MNKLDNFIVLDSIYGRFIIPRNYTPGPPTIDPATALLKTGQTHIEQELNNIFAVVDTLEDNSIIIDGGANIGFFSIPVAQRVKEKNTRIISFEPQKELFYALGGTIALNELRNVFLHNLGIGSSNFVAQISDVDYSEKTDYGMVTISKDKVSSEVPYLRYSTAEVITIDSMKLPRLDFLKLDVEGFECEALRGAIKTIKKYKPWIWIEYNMAGKENIENELKDLTEYSYHILDWQNMLVAPKHRLDKTGWKLP
jgi:FkbM family methyltransferase